MKKNFIILFMVAALATVSQAVFIDSFVNADFDSGIVTTPGPFKGFDAPAAPEIIGWSNYGNIFDAGVEASGAWWLAGYAYGNCAFVNVGGGASNKSSYVIQEGDQFTVSFIGDGWGATSARVSLWYDNPANVFGSFDAVMNAWHFDPHSNATTIGATPVAIGGTLGVTIENLGPSMLGFDEVTVVTVPLVNNSPANGATMISPVRTNADNDLVFTVYNPDISKVDVLFGREDDPNLTTKPAYKIIDDMAVTPGQYTVNLESLTADLLYGTTYYWKVIGYEPNSTPGATDYFEFPGPVWSFTTTPESPLITLEPPAYTAVNAGESSIVLSANGINGDFQWYKDGSLIVDAVGVYAGTATNTLTIYDVQLADEGYYTLKVSSIAGEDESTPARVITKRLTSHYPVEVINEGVTPDIVGGFDMAMTNEAASAGLPVLDTEVASATLGTYSLKFDNADHATDPNGQFAQIAYDVAKFEDITIGLWVKYNGGVVWQRIFDIGSSTTSYMFLSPAVGGGGLRFAITTGSGEQQVNAPALSLGEWTHVAVTINGITGRLYVNGALVDTNPNMTLNPIDVIQTRNYVGKSQWPDAEFNGMIDDLKIYNYGRTTEQIALDYLAVKGGWVCNNEVTVLLYDFNDDCQVTLADFAMFSAEWLDSNRITLP